ncbi:MAG: hypothetical protein NXH91_12560 [Phyllobacteriaceae bacterium]|nr:hypothetical protein [Phyllobacteriaceae bacterium]
MVEQTFAWIAAVAALIAAVCWLRAATVKVPPRTTPDDSGWTPASFGSKDMEVFLTIRAQGRWNAAAASFAAIGAASTAISLAAGQISV